MVTELEQLRERFKQIGREDVAQDLSDVLEEHKGTLPQSLPETNEFLIVHYMGFQKVVTRGMLRDPNQLPDLLDTFLSQVPVRSNSTTRGITRGVLLRHNTKRAEGERSFTLGGLITMSDQELLGIKGFGQKSLVFFRKATQQLREKFVQGQIQSS